MRPNNSLLFLLVSVSLGNALAEDIKTDLLNSRPHNVAVTLPIVKRDTPADIDVADSDTVPVEDGPPAATASSKSANAISIPSRASYTSTTTKYSQSDSKAIEIQDPESGKSNSPFLMSISMIAISEIGDKTFLVAALMAMRHSRAVVFSAAFSALAVMTVLSGVVGHALPTLISQRVTQFLAAGLFVIFGVKLAKEGLEMSKDAGVDEELAEVEEEIAVSDMNYDMDHVEGGGEPGNNSLYDKAPTYQKYLNIAGEQFKNLTAHVLSPLWAQVFIMTFLGEWGDRSQIATIAMAAGSDYWPVIWGAVIGHAICTAAAVVGGKMLASRISMRTVTLGGAFAFFVFAIIYFHEAFYSVDE